MRAPAHRRVTGRLVIATHNPGKLAEMRELLAPYKIEAISAGEMGLHEPDESGTSFRANARIKAESSAKAAGLPAFADDSGLVVDALEGAPGIYSARWAGPDKNFQVAMETVEQKLRGPAQRRKHNARPISSPRCASPGRTGMWKNLKPASTARSCGRRAVTKASATIRSFCLTGTRAPSARCPSEEKHGLPPKGKGLSHRARAFLKLAEACLG